ncbi:centromere protein I-like [Glandiceps talaboti]
MTEVVERSKEKSAPETRRSKLSQAVSYFTNETSDTKTRGNTNLHLSLIEDTATEYGLSPENILKLATVAGSARFSESVTVRLIKSLIPSKYVPEDAVVRVVSWMCTNKPSSNVQTWLTKWMITIYDYLEDNNILHALYPMLFLFIDNEQMCPSLCHLLYRMTRKEDVKQYRVQKLLEIQHKVGVQPHIMGLLSIYKVYSPATIMLSTAIGNRQFFPKIHPKWTETVHRVVEKNKQHDGHGAKDTGSISLLSMTDVRATKRSKLDIIPAFQTTASEERSESNNKMPMAQIQTFKELLQNIDRLQLPSQIGSVLKYPKLYHVMSCIPEQTIYQRLSYWLYEVLCEEIISYSGVGTNPRAEYLLQHVINFTEFIQEGIPICENFITRYLLTWNGTDYRIYILQLITRFRLWPFQKMNDLLLEPIHKLFFSSSVYFKCQVIFTYTQLLRNFISIEWSRYKNSELAQQVNIAETTIQIHEPSQTLFNQEYEEFDAVDTISNFIASVDRLCAVGLQVETNNALLMNYTLSFCEVVSKLHVVYGFPCTYLPSIGIVLKALHGSDASALSRVCSILCNYKFEVHSLKKLSNDKSPVFLSEVIKQLNDYILLVSNLLWRNKAFSPTPSISALLSMEHKKPPDIDLSTFNDSFSLWQHPALSWYAHSYQSQNRTADASVDKRQLTMDYLKYLKSKHLHGVHSFITTFIKSNLEH